MAERYARRRFTDRKDGRRLRTISPLFQLTPFIMLDPGDAVNSFTDQAEVSAIESWLRQKRRDGYEDISLIHVVIAAYVRMLAARPAMNRFVAGRYLYARDDIDVVLSYGRGGGADAGALTVNVRFQPSDTVFDVFRKINTQVDNLKADQSASQAERIASTLVKTPRFVLRFAVAVVHWLDFHGLLRQSWTRRSPFHGSAVISDEGSYQMPPISRSINRLGSLPVSLSIGRVRSAIELDRAGQAQDHKYVDFTVSYDGRIADSAYIGSAFRFFRHYLANPQELEQAPARVNEDAM